MSVIRMEDHEVAKRGNWKVWAKRINGAWQKTTEGILETGQLLLESKADLKHGEFINMVQLELNFSRATAFKLMKIAADPTLSNVSHAKHLPPSWNTLYQLTQLPPPLLLEKINDGTITPKTERKEIMELLTVSDEKNAPKKKPTVKQKSGPSIAPAKELFVEELKQLSKAQQVDEIFSVMGQLGLTFIDFGVSTLSLGKGK